MILLERKGSFLLWLWMSCCFFFLTLEFLKKRGITLCHSSGFKPLSYLHRDGTGSFTLDGWDEESNLFHCPVKHWDSGAKAMKEISKGRAFKRSIPRLSIPTKDQSCNENLLWSMFSYDKAKVMSIENSHRALLFPFRCSVKWRYFFPLFFLFEHLVSGPPKRNRWLRVE